MRVRITTTKFLLNIVLLGSCSAQNLEPFQLSEYLNGSFLDSGWNGTWISDSSFIFKESGNIYKVDAADGQKYLFLDKNIFTDYPSSTLTFSNDLKFVLIKHNIKRVFRRSDTAQYTVYDIDEQQYHHLHNGEALQYVVWDRQGKSLAYVYLNNIYYAETVGGIATPRQITSDGVPGIIYNGVPDWVYEEEVLSSGSALWFSPNGKGLVFIQFDDRKVNDFHYFIYGNSTVQYPTVATIKYPKSGMTNPTIDVKYVNLKNKESEETNISYVDYVSKDQILKDVMWATNIDVVMVSLNRVQNTAVLLSCRVTTNKCNAFYMKKLRHGWIDLKIPIYNSDGSKFLLLLSEPEGKDTYRHLSLVENHNISKRKRLTFGKRVVISVYGWDEARSLVYYAGTIEGDHGQQHVYVVDIKTGTDRCLTCDVATPEGPCEFASGSFSAKFSYYAQTCGGPGPKIVQVKSLTSSASFVWEDNADLRKRLSKKYRPIIKRVHVPLSSGYRAYVRLRLPPTLDEGDYKKYPMVVKVYGGPNSNEISNAYSAGEENYFVTNRQYIYASIDGRGSGKNGDNLMFEVYRRLGTVEMEDQIEVTKYLHKHYKYIDANRTGIWGWSYGGFATLSILAKDTENVFKWGLAVAAVTSFRLYDTIYTERYMGLPTKEDNEQGYNNTDLTRSVEAFRNKLFFIVHGNADDNVHYQQSMILSRALEKADIMFLQQSYPDEGHLIGSVRPHLYHTIDRFFDRGFHSGISGNKAPNLSRRRRTRF
ncbi:venom dipeptidyl peptidase 4-like isoform X1 [Photinus pyralis]|nr:venom dipeptidyl peptidase 4-like isoform X1 [Photinus pyralis]